jgi:hypothetical protein
LLKKFYFIKLQLLHFAIEPDNKATTCKMWNFEIIIKQKERVYKEKFYGKSVILLEMNPDSV